MSKRPGLTTTVSFRVLPEDADRLRQRANDAGCHLAHWILGVERLLDEFELSDALRAKIAHVQAEAKLRHQLGAESGGRPSKT